MHWLGWLIGIYPVPAGTSPMYQLWSGFIPALAILSLVGTGIRALLKLNCHVHGCWRLGRYDAGPYKVCHVHHPRDDITRKTSPADVNAAYTGGRCEN